MFTPTFRKSCIVVLLLMAQYFSVRAQWSNDPAVNSPLCTATNDQTVPVSVPDGSGGVIVAWADARSGPSNGNIFAQRLNAAGVPQWTVNGIAICTAANSQASPAIISDGAGGAIIAWHDPRTSIFNNDIYAQRVDASGNTLWAANGVPISTAVDHQSWVLLVTDGASGAIITWLDQRSGLSEVYAQRISAGGIVQWATDGLALRTGFPGYSPQQIISDGVGGAIISWYDPLGTGGPDPYVQRINSSGSLLWGAIGVNVCAVGGSQEFISIASDGASGVMVCWTDDRSGEVDLYAQRVNSAGAPQWTTNGVVVCNATQNQQNNAMIGDGSGGVIIAWTDDRSGTQSDVYAQRVSSTGLMQWAANGVPVVTAANNQFVPRMVAAASSESLIAWTDSRGGNYDVFAQRLDGNGNPQWAVNGIPVSTATNSQDIVTAASNGSGGIIIAWEDTRGSNIDIYIQGVSSSGSLCSGPSTPGTIAGPSTLSPGASGTYSVTNDPGATSYSWTLPAGWAGTSTTNSINVTAGLSGGTVSVTASNSCGPSAASSLNVAVSSATHSIVSFAPASGPIGTTVVLTGLNFDATPANNSVAFNGVPASVSASNATSITTQVPAGATSGPITVGISGVSASSPTDFTVSGSALIVYNAISANGDVLNEQLRIEGMDLTLISRVVIVDRLGRVVYERAGYDNGSGSFRGVGDDGKELATGTYFYSLEFSNGAPKLTGYIALKR